MNNAPESFCELNGWIGSCPRASELDEWSGKEPPSVDDFRSQFRELVRKLGGAESSLLDGLSLVDTRRAAQSLVQRLIVQRGEVLPGWEDAFRTTIPGLAEPFVSFPPHPIRTASDVLQFMDRERQQADTRPPCGGLQEPEWRRGCLQSGIKCALLWMTAHGHCQGNLLIRDLPDDLLALDTLFRSIREKVESLANPKGEGTPVDEKAGQQTATVHDESTPPDDLLHELTPQQGKIVKYLWNAKHATKWQSQPADCWRGGRPTSDQDDRTIESALERLRDRLNVLRTFGLTLEVHSAKQTTKLLHNSPRK